MASTKTDDQNAPISAQEILDNRFWNTVTGTDEEGETYIKKIIIDQLKFCRFLYNHGFRRYDIEEDSVFVQIRHGRIIKQITVTEMQDFVYRWIRQLPKKDLSPGEAHPDQVESKILTGVSYYFNKQRLFWLRSKEPIVFNRDTLDKKFVYYSNGFVTVGKEGIKFHSYEDLDGYIWDSEILDREYQVNYHAKGLNVPMNFLNYVAGEKPDRLNDLLVAIGYFLHDYNEYKIKALLLTDSEMEEDSSNGRTGKTLFCRLLGYMVAKNPLDPTLKSYVELNGKDFDPKDKHKYSPCGINTKILVINDLKPYFHLDTLYNDISEGLTVDKKNMQPFKIHPKMILTTNRTIQVEGKSSRDRVIEFEFSDYFNTERTPETQFGHWFIRDWDKDLWAHFDSTFLHGIRMYFMNGCKLNEPSQLNLNKRKFKEHTSTEFYEFMMGADGQDPGWSIEPGKEYDQQEIMDKFMNIYKDYSINTPDRKYKMSYRRFSQWVARYVNLIRSEDLLTWEKSAKVRRRHDGSGFYFFELDPNKKK